MLSRIEHVAIAVGDLEAALDHYARTWGLEAAHRERVDDQRVEEALLPVGDSYLQLIAPTDDRSTVARFIERRGEGLHHIAVEVEDLVATLAELKRRGVRLIDEAPRRGGRGHMVAFVHPAANRGLLVELVQAPSPR